MSYDLVIIITAVINTAVNILREIREWHRDRTKRGEQPLFYPGARVFILLSTI